jgi:predicted permease
MGNLLQDVRYSFRILLKNPAFSAIAVLMLALGIGANTAIFSIVNAVMFGSVPVNDPKNLMVLEWTARKPPEVHWYSSYGETGRSNLRGGDGSVPRGTSFSHPFLEQLEKAGLFEGVAGFAGGGGSMTFSGNGPATTVSGQLVSGNFFPTMGVKPHIGRLIQPSDDRADAAPVAVLNYQYWQRAFGASDSVLGRVVKINSVPFTIVGVAEPKFVSLSMGNVFDLWLPMNMAPAINRNFAKRHNDVTAWWVIVAGRLKPGTTAAEAAPALEALFRNSVTHNEGKPLLKPEDEPKILLHPAPEALVGGRGNLVDPLRVMSVAVGLVLLIACANVAGLVLARATSRKREIAIRLAVGARRSRILRQLLTESVILALLGGALGTFAAIWGAHAIILMVASGQDRPLGVTASLDLRVLLFTVGISVLTGILFGLAPALRSLRLDLTPTLKDASDASTGPQERRRWFSLGKALVGVQAALAIIVLTGAGLLLHTLANLETLNPGFDTRNILTFGLIPQFAGYKPPQTDNLYRDLHEKISAMPGVMSVSYSQQALLSGNWGRTSFRYVPPGGSQRVEVEADWMPVSQDFFTTMKLPVLAGRQFTPADFARRAANSAAEMAHSEAKPGAAAPPLPTLPVAVLVNDSFAKKYFPGVNPLGLRFGEEDGTDPHHPERDPGCEIIGIVQDAKYNSLRRDIDPTIYAPLTGGSAVWEVRTAGDPHAMIPMIRNLINQQDSNLPMINIKTQAEHVATALTQERIMAQLSGFFGLVALLLCCAGLYGLLSYEVSRRTREIGIRMALGATRRNLIKLVVSQGLVLAIAGTAVGAAGAIAVSRLLTKLLFGVKAGDPVTLITVVLLLVMVALVAAFVPARRATRVDPMVALRYE